MTDQTFSMLTDPQTDEGLKEYCVWCGHIGCGHGGFSTGPCKAPYCECEKEGWRPNEAREESND